IAEFLHDFPKGKAKTLFATHYHELNELENKFERVKNFNVSVKESGNKVIFLRKLQPGGSQHSFGIHVAKMAGIPPAVVNRANELLEELEEKTIAKNLQNKIKKMPSREMQLSIFQQEDPVLNKLKEWLEQVDPNTLTPIEALMKLHELKDQLKKKQL
nr:DNA mismatch repair protein MutS [Chitinophagales bacterium]